MFFSLDHVMKHHTWKRHVKYMTVQVFKLEASMQREAIDNILVFTSTNKINGFIAVYEA